MSGLISLLEKNVVTMGLGNDSYSYIMDHRLLIIVKQALSLLIAVLAWEFA